MTRATAPAAYKSPLHEMTQATPTCLWNDSASIQELTYSMEHGAVGATDLSDDLDVQPYADTLRA